MMQSELNHALQSYGQKPFNDQDAELLGQHLNITNGLFNYIEFSRTLCADPNAQH